MESRDKGKLSILRTNICKAALMLKTQNEWLKADKTELAVPLADISHQLKTPLTSMMVMNDLLLDETDDARREELLRTQSAQLDRMSWPIQTLLKISRLDAGTIVLRREEVLVKDLVHEATKPFLVQMDVRDIALTVDVADETVVCDFMWTVEVLENVIENCIEHTGDGERLL